MSVKMVAVPREYVGSGTPMAMRVAGDCMQLAGIDDGDTVVVDCGANWQDGDVVVAKWGDGLTVKRAYRFGKQAILRPDDTGYMPLMIPEAEIVGVVTAVKKTNRFVRPLPGPSRAELRELFSYWRLDEATGQLVKAYDA